MVGPQPISLAEMDSYCRMFGVRDIDRFVRLVRAADRGFLARSYERAKQKQPPDGGGTKKARRN